MNPVKTGQFYKCIRSENSGAPPWVFMDLGRVAYYFQGAGEHW